MNLKIGMLCAALAASVSGIAAFAADQDIMSGAQQSSTTFSSGGYVGLGVGLASNKVKQSFKNAVDMSTLLDNHNYSYSQSEASSIEQLYYNKIGKNLSGTILSPAFQLKFGFDCKLRNSPIVTGFFAGGSVNGAHSSMPSVVLVNQAGQSLLNVVSGRCRMQDRGSFLAGVRLGGIVNNNTLLYVLAGWEIHDMKIVNAAIRNASPLAKKSWNMSKKNRGGSIWINYAQFGGGFETNLTNNIVAGLESTVSFGRKESKKFANMFDQKARLKLRSTILTAMVTLKYKFPTCRAM
ncbi:hypothetical protein [Candidatus Hydrogenosomobacter endosymbioticus]|uniref:Uncharacterized protein n=1 Tax=Candidatus Hydrogenosomobacter endosymbioticus TaxID=2558174 RepID=A0ABM7V7Z4_9PROT|nr:hypothetical protein [Candidatus Hydrogenosomobacter endosymbioticus]BDB95882.1 hypothetical protein HYD_0150 [Candidatus Hydrogenosomobacter endosymbioticus]